MCMICMIVCCICFVQIPRYIITIHELLAHTPHDHVERKSLEFAQSKLEELSQVRTTLIIIWSCEIVIVTSNNAQHEMRSCSYQGLSTQTSITPFTTSKIIWIAIWIEIWILIQMYPLTRDIYCSIQQSTSHCCSLFNHCYIAIHLTYGLKLSRSRSRSSVYMGQNFPIQIVI